MALDNAQFIAELSITDPPGSDPLSQGDDQIRAIKRATFQSLPLLDKAVNITADQMNLMAIKNEANVFTAAQTIQDASLVINAVIDNPRSVIWQIAGLNAWAFSLRAVGENNDMHFQRYDALGVFLDIPFRIDFTTGVVDFKFPPTISGAPLWVAGELRMFVISATPGTNWFVANGTNGTVNINDRALLATGISSVGTLLAPNLVGLAAARTTGSTAISTAQMPAHDHRVFASTNGNSANLLEPGARCFGAVKDNPLGLQFTAVSAGGDNLVENTGSGNGHTHSIPSGAVTEDGTDRNTVRPLSIAVSMFQYVP